MNDLQTILANAVTLAAKAHNDQLRWDGRPFILHPISVMNNVLPADNGTPTEWQYKLAIVAILHDVVEDTEWDLNNLAEELELPSELVVALKLLTKDPYPEGASPAYRSEVYAKYISAISLNTIAAQVKLADLQDNMNIKGPPPERPLNAHRLEKYRRAHFYLKGILDRAYNQNVLGQYNDVLE